MSLPQNWETGGREAEVLPHWKAPRQEVLRAEIRDLSPIIEKQMIPL